MGMRKLPFYLVLLSICLSESVLATCANPDNRFDYQLASNSNGDYEISFDGAAGVRRTITDNDGLLTMMSLYRSWQTNGTDAIASTDIVLLKNVVDKALTKSAELLPAMVTSLEALKSSIASANNVRFATIEPLLQGVLSNTYQGSSRGYPISSSDGTENIFQLCRDSGIRTVICNGPNGAQSTSRFGECSPAYRDFCGPVRVSLAFESRVPAERIKIAPGACHPVGLGQQVLSGGREVNPATRTRVRQQ